MAQSNLAMPKWAVFCGWGFAASAVLSLLWQILWMLGLNISLSLWGVFDLVASTMSIFGAFFFATAPRWLTFSKASIVVSLLTVVLVLARILDAMGFAALVGLASVLFRIGFIAFIGVAAANWRKKSSAGLKQSFVFVGTSVVAIIAHFLLVAFGDLPDYLYYPLEKTVWPNIQLACAVALFFTVYQIGVVREVKLMEKADLSPEFRIKRFFNGKVRALWMALAAFTPMIMLALIGQILFDSAPALTLIIYTLPLLATVIVLFNVWIPGLIAYRAMQKGKSWDAFFWLSALVSPLIMWIIAEASADTRGMAPAQYAQQPVQYAPAAPQAPVAPATDTRPCPQCAEDIKAAAKLCKHCGSKVEPIA